MKKQIVKQLRKIADSLPVVTIQTMEQEFLLGSELKELYANTPWVDGEESHMPPSYVDTKMYSIPLPVFISINHTRRLKSLYLKFGMKGVEGYKAAVYRYHEKNKKND